LASAPAPKHGDKHAEQPIAAENPCLTRTIELTTVSLAPLQWLSLIGRTAYARQKASVDAIIRVDIPPS
jgi:hypothetical protein